MKEVQLTALLETFQFSNVQKFAKWFRLNGAKLQRRPLPDARGRYRKRRIHPHLVVDRETAERLLAERYKELDIIPPLPRYYTVADAAKLMKISRQKLEQMIREDKVDVLVDGYWMQHYLQRGNW